MNILFITGETPIFPGGGIGVYFGHIVPALEKAGHKVHLLTWRHKDGFIEPQHYSPFNRDRTHIEVFDVDEAMRTQAPRPYSEVLSNLLADLVIELANRWGIDVIETVDFHAPGLIAFQKLQTSKEGSNRLLTVYNHGLHEVIVEANQDYPSADDKADIVSERKLMRICDHLIAPSQASKRMCLSTGISAPITVVREPFEFQRNAKTRVAPTHNIQFQGRLSVQKGMDRLSLIANVINSVVPVGRIDLIGSAKTVAYSGQSSLEFLRDRLEPGLSERIVHHDQMPREAVLDLLEPGAFAPHLGTNETFSYACVEAIDAGLIPLVHDGNAMFEFLPPDLADLAFDARLSSIRDMQAKLEKMLCNSVDIRERIKAHCEDTLQPDIIASALSDLYESALYRKRGKFLRATSRPLVGPADITVLIPACDFQPKLLSQTLNSISSQTGGMPKVLLCHDGSTFVFGPRVRAALRALPDLKVIAQVRAGEPTVLNTLAEECRTELALILKQGQMIAPDAMARLVAQWNARCLDADAMIVPQPVAGQQEELAHQLLPEPHAHCLDELRGQAALIKTSVLRSIGFDATRRNGERIDWAFWLTFDARGHRAIILPDPGMITGSQSDSIEFSEPAQYGTQLMIRDIMKAGSQ